MAHEVEKMFYVREKPWHGLGTRVETAPTSADALHLAGLDWEVNQTPIYTQDCNEIPNYKANIRSSDGKVLGVVSDRYKIVQNTDAFQFTDALVGETENGLVTYESAGSLKGGKVIWLLAKLPQQKILGDTFDPYLCFTNSHDGSGSIRACMTPIRVVCNNTLNLALSKADRQWSARHVGALDDKLEEAKLCLGLANSYMTVLAENAEILAETKLRREQIDEILSQMFPIDDTTTETKKRNIQKAKDEYYIAYYMPDLKQFQDTAWGAVNAMTDMVAHAAPGRKTPTYEENRWGNIMNGHVMVDQFLQLVQQKVGV